MKKSMAGILLLFFAAFVTGCSEDQQNSADLSVEHRTLNEEEKVLISKTGIEGIEYFELNGTLAEGDDLPFSVEIYKNGKLVEDNVYTYGESEKDFNQAIISHGYKKRENTIDFFNGMVNGLSETHYDSEGVGAWSFTSLLNEKTELVKDKDVYLAAWIGTKDNELSSVSVDGDGSLSDSIEEADIAYVFKITLTDAREE